MRTPPSWRGSLKSALAGVLASLFAGLLRLLPRVLARLLLALLPWIVALATLLRLALVVLRHLSLQKLSQYNLNDHHSNYRTYLCSMHAKNSVALGYIFIRWE
jgi:hypothetical protein